MGIKKESDTLAGLSLYSHFFETEWLHASTYSSQAEPDGGGQLSTSERGTAERRVPSRHHASSPGFTGRKARHGGSAHFQTGQCKPIKQGTPTGMAFNLNSKDMKPIEFQIMMR